MISGSGRVRFAVNGTYPDVRLWTAVTADSAADAPKVCPRCPLIDETGTGASRSPKTALIAADSARSLSTVDVPCAQR
jgi:hypothetical protein